MYAFLWSKIYNYENQMEMHNSLLHWSTEMDERKPGLFLDLIF